MESSETALRVLVCFAVKEEAAPFLKFAKADPATSVLITGIGKHNAEKALRESLPTKMPGLVLTCGFAGGLNPDLALGDVVFETTDKNINNRLWAARARESKFLCADRIATTVAEKRDWRAKTGCDVVDMESEVISKICREKQIPCATVRVISDTADQDLPLDFNTLMTAEQTLSLPKLALALAGSPGKIPKLLELQRHTRFAANELARVLSKLIGSLRNPGA